MRPSPLLLVLALPACDLGERALTGACPAGETCSDDTPRGLSFSGTTFADDFLAFGPPPTLAGGTQDIHLAYNLGDGTSRPLDRPYIADDDGGLGVMVDHTDGPVVTLRGVASHSNYLRITDADGALDDRKLFDGATLTKIEIVPAGLESITQGDAIVFAAGAQDLAVALIGKVDADPEPFDTRVVDESMTIALDGATRTRWDVLDLPDAAVGLHDVSVTAGVEPEAAVTFEVVAGPDSLLSHDPILPLQAGSTSFICFSPHSAGRHVAGLAWTFTVDNGPIGNVLFRNCATVLPDHEGPLHVTASAGGLIVTATYTAAPKHRSVRATLPSSQRQAPGERAAAF